MPMKLNGRARERYSQKLGGYLDCKSSRFTSMPKQCDSLGAVMPGGFFNHYDDPDEFWDEEPLVPIGPSAPPRTPPAAPSPPPPPVPPAPEPRAATPERDIDGSERPRVGSQLVSMEVDRGFLPTRIDFAASWSRHVAPHEVGEELMRAYRKAASDRLQLAYSSDRWPTPQEIFESAVPDRRTTMMVLLETASRNEYSDLQRKIIRDAVVDVFGNVSINGEHPVTVSADRHYVQSIRVASWWAASTEPQRIADEILACTPQIRAARPRFEPRRDYSRYSDEDLEYHVARHREQLIEEGFRSRVR